MKIVLTAIMAIALVTSVVSVYGSETTGDEEKKSGADCWVNGDFIGKELCDTHGLPLCSELTSAERDGGVRCFDEADAPDVDESEDEGE
jgi:hypothetical protein